jgi:hypothetical protein
MLQRKLRKQRQRPRRQLHCQRPKRAAREADEMAALDAVGDYEADPNVMLEDVPQDIVIKTLKVSCACVPVLVFACVCVRVCVCVRATSICVRENLHLHFLIFVCVCACNREGTSHTTTSSRVDGRLEFRLFIANANGKFFGMSESLEASTRR